MKPCNAHIIQSVHTVTECFSRNCRFLCNGYITCTACSDKDHALGTDLGHCTRNGDTCIRKIFVRDPEFSLPCTVNPCNKNGLCPVFNKSVGNGIYLCRVFACTIDHFRNPLPECPVQIRLGKAQILKRRFLKFKHCRIRTYLSFSHIFHQFFYVSHMYASMRLSGTVHKQFLNVTLRDSLYHKELQQKMFKLIR